MARLRQALAFVGAAMLGAVTADAAILYAGAYPNSLLLVDESKGGITGRIMLSTGLPTSIRLSNDKKRLYVTTITTGGIEVIDTTTRKVINSFSLNTPTLRYRFNGGAPDPTGKYFYTIVTELKKTIDHYEVSKPKYAVIDLEQKKIVRTYDVAKEEDSRQGFYRASMLVSDDGRSLYMFRDKVIVLNPADFSVIDRIDLSKPETGNFEGASFGPPIDTLAAPDTYISIFNSADPYTHNRVFGVGRFNLATRAFDFTPIGPAPASMAGLQIAPDGKTAYTVVTTGTFGTRRCEFWRFDLGSNTITNKAEFECRSRFTFGISANGQKLYIHGAGYEIDVFDARTLRHEKLWDLSNDMTGAGVVAVP